MSGHVIAYQCGHGSCNSAEIERKTGAVGSATSAATFWLAHNYYRLKTDTLDHELCDECLFDLNNGADDEGTMNRDLYLSFNRVNSGKADRNGYGVCFVKLSWVCNVA